MAMQSTDPLPQANPYEDFSSTTILYNILTCSCVMWRVFFKQPCLWPGYRFKVILAKVGDFGLLTL